MIAVIFEVVPATGRKDEYLSIAADIRPLLDQVDGFISVERFQSLSDPDKILSLSFFKDEDAIRQWRSLEAHRSAQQAGRSGTFSDYRLRVASVIRDYSMNDRADVPADSCAVFNEIEDK